MRQPIRLSRTTRARLRAAIAAAPGWQSIREARNWRLSTMRSHELVAAARSLKISIN